MTVGSWRTTAGTISLRTGRSSTRKHRPKIVWPSGERQLAPNRGLAAVTLILCLAFALSSAFILLHSKIFRRYGLSYLIWKSGANFTAPCGKTHPASALLPDHPHCFLATSEFPFALPSRRTRQRVSAASCPASSPASASRKPPCESAPCGTEPTQRTVFSDLAGAMRSSWHFYGCAGLQGMIGLNLSRTNMGGTAHRLEGERPSEHGQSSRVIECPSSVLQKMGASALERFNSLPHGGSEIFGILLGTHNSAGVRITGFRALITEHEFARPGELSDEECAAFARAMPASSGEPGASPEAAVGAFRSHPRSSLMLGERDLEIANTLFPQPWQVTLVLRPGNSAMTRGRIFFRKSAGPLAAGAGLREFTVDPAGIEIPRESAVRLAELLPAAVAPIQDALPRTDALPVLAAGAGSAEQPPESTPEQPHVPEALRVLTLRMTPGWATALRWPAALFSIAGLVAALYWFGMPQGLGLRVFDNQGQLRTSSDRNVKPVSPGRNAHVEIND